MRDCRYFEKGCNCYQNDERYCQYDKDKRYKCLWYEGKNE